MSECERNPSNELLELLKKQSRSAKDWSYSIAGAFWQNKGQVIDEEYLFTCLANAMMSMHDSIFNNEVLKLQADNKTMREALEFVRDTLDEEKINLGVIKAIDACVFHALEKVKE